MNLEINWANSQIECEGSTRPDGSGIRLSFAGPPRSDGRRTRIVFGIRSATEGRSGRSLPTNVTVMFEGEARLFGTRGDDRCTVDKREQEPYRGTGRSLPLVSSGGQRLLHGARVRSEGRGAHFPQQVRLRWANYSEDDVAALDTFPRASVDEHGTQRHRSRSGRRTPSAPAAGLDVHQ